LLSQEFRRDQLFSQEIRIWWFNSRKLEEKNPFLPPNILLVYNPSPGITSLAFEILYKKMCTETTAKILESMYNAYTDTSERQILRLFSFCMTVDFLPSWFILIIFNMLWIANIICVSFSSKFFYVFRDNGLLSMFLWFFFLMWMDILTYMRGFLSLNWLLSIVQASQLGISIETYLHRWLN